MPPARDLPDLFKRSAKPGRAQTPQLEVIWSDVQVDVRAPSFQLNAPLREFVALQVSRSIKLRRRLLRASALTHLLHVELRAARLARVRLSAVIEDAESLDGLPFLEGSGDVVPAEALLDLVAAALAQGVPLVEWDDNDARLPTDELERRAGERELRAREARSRASKAQARGRAAAAKRPASAGSPYLQRVSVGLGGFGLLLFIVLFAIPWIAFQSGLDEVQAVVAPPDDPGRLLVVGSTRYAQQATTQLRWIDARTGVIEREADWSEGSWFGYESAALWGASSSRLWLCGGEGGLQAWDLKTLEPRFRLNDLRDDPKLRELGLDDSGWLSCANRGRFALEEGAIVFMGNDARWYRVTDAGDVGELPRKVERGPDLRLPTHSALSSLPLREGEGEIAWDSAQRQLVLREDDRAVRALGPAGYVGFAWLRDTSDPAGAPIRLHAPEGWLVTYQRRLDDPQDRLTRVSLDGAVRWDVALGGEPGQTLVAAVIRGEVLVLVWSGPVVAVGYALESGERRWEQEP